MRSKLSNKIQRQVLFGFIALLTVFFITASVQWQALRGATHQATIFSQITLLQQQVSEILELSQHYKNNAPRDFESYNRDVALFYNDIVKKIEITGKGFEFILNEEEQPLSKTLYQAFSSDIKRDIETSHELLKNWNSLASEFYAALGEDKKNPRLEWGADLLIKKLPAYYENLNIWINKHQILQQRKSTFLKKTIIVLFSTAILLSLFGIFWIYLMLLKRVRKTAMACKRVADGEFGYQIPNNKHDEIGQLIDAFNHLSSRTESVLSMVDGVANAKSNQELITAIAGRQNIMGCSWLGLMTLSEDKGSLQLLATNRQNNLSGWNFKGITLDKGQFGSSVESSLINNESLIVNDISQLSIEDPHARFLRALIMQTSCEFLAIVPLRMNERTLGALALGRKDNREWREDELQLLENLNELISNRLLIINPDLLQKKPLISSPQIVSA